MIVCSGKKRSLRALDGVEVEVVSQSDETLTVTCRRCDDRNLIKLKKAQLKPKPATQPENTTDPQQKLREEQQRWMSRFQTEILDLEDLIPWNGVTKSWKAKRGSWRKRIMAALTLQDIGEALKELLRCLVWERDHRIGHSVLQWENEIDEMCNDSRDYKKFSKLWKRLSTNIQKWIQDRATGTHLTDPSVSRKRADLAFHTMKRSVSEDPSSLNQIPLNAILHEDPVALGHLKQLITTSNKRQRDVASPRKRPKTETQSAERSAAV